MEFSDYIVYVDESGDHSLTSIDENFPVFCLAFSVFRKEDYVRIAVPLMQDFKFRWFGHDAVVMHESDILKRRRQFAFLQFDEIKNRFMDDLTNLMQAMPMKVFATVIRKEQLKRKYAYPDNPYELSLLFCMERVFDFLEKGGHSSKRCHILCESRSPKAAGTGKEDAALELEFRRIAAGIHYLNRKEMPCFDITFVSKLANSTGLQIADLIARPIALHSIRPYQPNRAFEVIRTKISGLKTFP